MVMMIFMPMGRGVCEGESGCQWVSEKREGRARLVIEEIERVGWMLQPVTGHDHDEGPVETG